MDNNSHKTLLFDRFTLDLTRGFLREGDRDIDLRPKAFQVLCYLASNAGRLITKQELFEAVWPAVSVSDDSLVQCIRELRDKMGDDNHRLIRTVHRRGYLLDTQFTGAVPQGSQAAPSARPVSSQRDQLRIAPNSFAMKRWSVWLSVAGISAVIVGVLYVNMPALFEPNGPTRGEAVNTTSVSARPTLPNEPFTADDAKRISELAFRKQLPLPAFQIEQTAGNVRDTDRRFVGIWMSEIGWLGSFRQMMLIVTSVDSDGTANGYAANGPAQAKSGFRGPSRYWPLRMRISGDTISFRDDAGEFEGTLTPQNKIALKMTFSDRVKTAWVLLDPVWTLIKAERPNE